VEWGLKGQKWNWDRTCRGAIKNKCESVGKILADIIH
jgi:hypothetical protein